MSINYIYKLQQNYIKYIEVIFFYFNCFNLKLQFVVVILINNGFVIGLYLMESMKVLGFINYIIVYVYVFKYESSREKIKKDYNFLVNYEMISLLC